jgi:hypothetical protein
LRLLRRVDLLRAQLDEQERAFGVTRNLHATELKVFSYSVSHSLIT